MLLLLPTSYSYSDYHYDEHYHDDDYHCHCL